ncbi:putative ferric-chelate reductase 1 [Gouania willdenowi]|uniref:putative ferric-chelate reductase 1 n=1 Tax=Gouania willdenowi TaxID=441366 RepID=UPI0010545C46|nr:putative ferric-chelate reductase 1 [Gouania willdenowi]XP_028330471.1 putative ferric-chelate reductase 1 [Gouania willdenowi]XP_028330472.1 putative ferric-chelate reductase 1 [Gouania willdenowi]
MDNRLIITIFFVTLSSAVIAAKGQKTLGTTATPTIGYETTTEKNIIVSPTAAENEEVTPTDTGNAMTPVDRTGCSTDRICLAEPSDCNPNASSQCIFASARQTVGQNFELILSGETVGYIAATLSTDTLLGGNDTTYVCARGKGDVIHFFTALLDNNQLILTNSTATTVRGRTNGTRLECAFNASIPDYSSSLKQIRASSLSGMISTGHFDPVSGALGTPTARMMSNVVNLMDPTSNTTNFNSNITTTLSSFSTVLHHSLIQALLVPLVIISLALV